MSENYNGVKFYSVSDLSCGYNLVKAQNIIEGFNEDFDYININLILELYNIECFFNNQIYLLDWTKEEIDRYNEIVPKFKKIVAKYFSIIDEKNITNILKDVDFCYITDFWKQFDKYKVYKRISNDIFAKLLLDESAKIRDILMFKDISLHYSKEVKEYLLNDASVAEILLDQYTTLKEDNSHVYYFPKILNPVDKENIIINYIQSDDSNLDYLKLIYESRSIKELTLPDKLRLKAKRKYENKLEKLMNQGSSFYYGVKVMFSDSQEELVTSEMKNGELRACYSKKYIKENLDYPTILNNFIYLFEYTDLQFRMQHVSKPNNMSIFERHLGIKGQDEYPIGIVFDQMNALATLQIKRYYIELENQNIRLEDVLKWFSKEYLKEEFGIEGFYLNLPSKDSTYLEKCRTILSEIDSLLKQFTIYVEDGVVDRQLLEISSQHMLFKSIPSLLSNKYIYPDGEKFSGITHLLFSDQSSLHYLHSLERNYSSFYELLFKEEVCIENFENYQKQDIRWLLEYGFIYEDENRKLKSSAEQVFFLKELYNDEVVSYHYWKKYIKDLEVLETKGLLKYETSLLSKPEQKYFNFLLNKAEFSNGWDLRNRYTHGTQPTDEKIHENDYFIFLRILVLLVIKINEEFCLALEEGIIKKS